MRAPERTKGWNCVQFSGARFGYAYVAKIKTKNKTKRAQIGQAGHVFRVMITCKKTSVLAGMVEGAREDKGLELCAI